MKKESKREASKVLMFRQATTVFMIYLMVSLTFLTANAMAAPIEAAPAAGNFNLAAFSTGLLDFLLPGVNAQSANSCCVKTIAGDYCQQGISQDVCASGYSSNKCSDIAVPECKIGTCVQQNGDCDASTTKEQCEDKSGFWSDQPLLAIPACTPTCCVYKSGAQIVDSKFVFFRNKCEKLPQAKDEKLDFEEQNIGFDSCRQIVPKDTKGYCTVAANAACTYTTKENCDSVKGDFSSKRCSSCQQNYKQECFNGDQGYGVYNFDSCDGPGSLINNCAISEICQKNGNAASCVDKTCSIDVKFTNLGYNTAYLGKGQVEVLTKNGASKVTAGVNTQIPLSQGDQACVNFQGPGEQHYAATCQLGELLVFGMSDTREKVCTFSNGRANAADNNYRKCTNAGKTRAGLLSNDGILSDIFDFLGGDFINPKWWDYWVIQPGLSDRASCEAQGMCVEAPNNDCVPKYAPASVDLCGDCSTTEASSPWNKCGEVTQCTSRGYCQLTENKMNPFAGATICAIQTATQKALIFGIGKLAGDSLKKARDAEIERLGGKEETDPAKATEGAVGESKNGEATNRQKIIKTMNDAGAYVSKKLEFLISAPGEFIKWAFHLDPKNPTAQDQAMIAKLDDAQKKALAVNNEINRPFSTIGVLDYMVTFFGGTSAVTRFQADAEQAQVDLQAVEGDVSDRSGLDKAFGRSKEMISPRKPYEKWVFTCGEIICSYDPSSGIAGRSDGQMLTSEQNAAVIKYGKNLESNNQLKLMTTSYNQREKHNAATTPGGSPAPARSKPIITWEQLSEAPDVTSLNKYTLPNVESTNGPNGRTIQSMTFVGADKVNHVVSMETQVGGDTKYVIEGKIQTNPSTVAEVRQLFVLALTDKSSRPAPLLPATPTEANTQTPAPNTFFKSLDTVASNKIDNSQYYGGLYYFPLRRATESSKAGYGNAITEWWKAQGGFQKYLLSQLKSMGKSMLIGYLFDKVLADYGGKNFSMLSVQYWIKKGVCYSLAAFVPLPICEKNNFLIPVLTCTVQTTVQGNVLANNACVPVGAQGMAGVQSGFDNCEKCQADSFPCTIERCQALSSDSSCAYDPYARQCTPDPEKVKSCSITKNADLKIIEVNNTAVPASNSFVMSDIPYENLQQDVRIRTSLTSECRYTTNKTEGWANMRPLVTDPTLKFHNVTVDMSDFTRQNFTTFFLCQDACRKQQFSQIVSLTLQKRAKPDLVGPVIVSKFPATDTPIEGGSNGVKEISISVETDENAECKFKEWPLAEGIDGFVGDVNNIEKIAGTLVNAGASEQTLDSEISLTALSYNDSNMTIVGTAGNFTKMHSVKFSGSSGPTKALENDKIYAYVFLCKDAKGNIGEVPGVVRFKVSKPFGISISEPKDTTVESKPTVEVSTDKAASCRYSMENKDPYSNMTSFDSSGGEDHETIINKLLTYGNHRVFVTCLDSDGFNIASVDKSFAVIRDTTAPRLVRAYKDADTLLISTNELTSCQYSFKQFTYGKGSEMTGNDPVENEHRAEWRPETTYFLSCRDRFGNVYSTSLKTTQEAASVGA